MLRGSQDLLVSLETMLHHIILLECDKTPLQTPDWFVIQDVAIRIPAKPLVPSFMGFVVNKGGGYSREVGLRFI